ncbi:MAG TPA: formylmethanofuran dehydrogenase subunit C, partial [Ancylobacter sp.]
MSGIVLKPRASLEARVDMTGITPDRLAGLTLSDIEHLSVPHGGRSAMLVELFFVERAPDGVLVIAIGDTRLDHVGAGMTTGEIIVEGPVGAWAGLAMSGGILRIAGNAGDFVGAELSGGRIELAGNAGDHAGGASSGSRRGLSGGVLRIAGSVGARAAT